jgi:hypothetical protein
MGRGVTTAVGGAEAPVRPINQVLTAITVSIAYPLNTTI